jgi:hypothetical protein
MCSMRTIGACQREREPAASGRSPSPREGVVSVMIEVARSDDLAWRSRAIDCAPNQANGAASRCRRRR